LIGSQINEEENTEIKNKESDNSEENETEEKENDIEEENDDIGNIGNFISKNEIKEENKNSHSDKDNEDENKDLNKKESIFLKKNKRLSKSHRYKSIGNFSMFKKKEKNSEDEEKNNDLNMNINSIIENEMIEHSNTRKRKRKKHITMHQKQEHFEKSVKNLLKEEAKKNEVMRFMEKCKEENQKINKYLYILYSVYIFCANEFIEINYKFFKCLINYYINYERFCKLNFLKISLNDIKKNIMDKVVFINKNSFMSIIFEKIKLSPTLLNDNFDLQNFIDYNDNYFDEIDKDNDDKKFKNKIDITGMNNTQKLFENDNWFSKIKKLSNEEIVLIDFLMYYCKVNDQINYFIEKIECFKDIQKIICSKQSNNNDSLI
jgi:chemotaxis protein histidine kinase CheA